MAVRAKKAAAPVEPEVDLSEFLEKEPTAVNKAEAAWLVECTGLEVADEDMDLVERIVNLVAGGAHRHWQKSEAAADLHEEIKEGRAAALAERAEARAAREAEKAERDAEAPPKRGRAKKATALDEEPEDEAPAPRPRRGRPAKAKVVEEVEEDEAPAPRKRPARTRAKSGAEAPF